MEQDDMWQILVPAVAIRIPVRSWILSMQRTPDMAPSAVTNVSPGFGAVGFHTNPDEVLRDINTNLNQAPDVPWNASSSTEPNAPFIMAPDVALNAALTEEPALDAAPGALRRSLEGE